MDIIGTGLEQRVVIEGIPELSALNVVVGAFAKYMRDGDDVPEDLVAEVERTAEVIDQAVTMSLNIRTQTRVDADDINRFGPPYAMCIKAAVATFIQKPELLLPEMDELQFMEAQTYFPPQ